MRRSDIFWHERKRSDDDRPPRAGHRHDHMALERGITLIDATAWLLRW
jgi:hypothetical protein